MSDQAGGGGPGSSQFPADAFISPDEPFQRSESEGSVPDDAFISPDEPIIRHAEDPSSVEGVVTGLGDGRHMVKHRHRRLDPDEVAHVLEVVSEGLKAGGAPTLGIPEGSSAFETALRAFIAGYLTRDV